MRKEVKFICGLFEEQKVPEDENANFSSRLRSFFRNFRNRDYSISKMTNWLSQKLSGNGIKTEVIYNDGIWDVRVELNNNYFLVWCSIGGNSCSLAVEFDGIATIGFLYFLYKNHDYHRPMKKLLLKIDAVLKSEPEVHDIVWFTRTKKGDPIDEADAPF